MKLSSSQLEHNSNTKRRDAWVTGIALYIFLCSIYILTASARLGNSDAGSMFAVTKSLYTHRWIDADPCTAEPAGNQCVAGVDGRNYSGYGIVSSVVAYPAFAVGWRVAALIKKDRDLMAGAAVSLSNCVLTPLIPALLYAWLLRLNYNRRVAVAVALLLGLATPLWFHGAKGFYSEPHFTLAFLASCFFITLPRPMQSGLAAGACFGLACGSRVYGLILLPPFLWYLLRVDAAAEQTEASANWQTSRLKRLLGFGLTLGVSLAGIGLINIVRFGSPFKTGYHLISPNASALLATPLLKGLYGVLLSGEVGLIWFAPLVVLTLWAWPQFHRAHPDEAWLCLWIAALSILFFAKYAAWHGGWSYGPRLLVPTLPFFMMPIAQLLQDLYVTDRQRTWPKVCVAAFIFLAFVIQVLGLTSSMSRYYNLMQYHEAVGDTAWWSGCSLLQNVDALPKLFTYKQPANILAKHLSNDERTAIADAAHAALPRKVSSDTYLANQPNGMNLMLPDMWLYKARLLGLPKILVLATTFLLSLVSLLSFLVFWKIVQENT